MAIAGGRLERQEERRIADTAGGNPLFLEQLVAYVGDRHSADHLPPALHALRAARLDRLDTVERSVLALGAVVGDAFEAASVHALATDVTHAEEVADLAVSVSASLGLGRVHARAAVERERIRLARRPETFRVQDAVVVAEQAARTLRGFGDELGLARAAYLMSDLSWLQGDVVGSSAHGERMLAHARRAGSGFDAATALSYLGWDLVEGPCPAPEAIARCDALAREAAGQRAAELSLLGCRAALLAMTDGYAEARGSMARARAGLAELHLREMAAYLAHLDAAAELLAGDPAAAERAMLDVKAIVAESGDRWFLSNVYVDLALAILAQGRHADAAEVAERVEAVPAPCDRQWVIKRHAVRALVASQRGDQDEGLREARAAVAAAEGTGLVVFCANAHRTLAEVLLAAGRDQEAAAAAGRALALDRARGNTVAAAATRRRFASSPAGRSAPAPRPRRPAPG